tara:strand:+ start:606 stop:875 length:270 start_codon:yes stop_codon:yes gene_type:complete
MENTDLRKYNRGTLGNKGGGRPTKNDEIKMIQELTPLKPIAYQKLEEGLLRGEFKFVQLYFNYFYGKPKQLIDLEVQPEPKQFEVTIVK